MTDSVIVLSPIDLPRYGDSVAITAGCGHQAWIGQASLNFTLDPGNRNRTQCLRCAMEDPEFRRSVEKQGGLGAVPGTREEVAAELGEEATDDLWRRFRVREDLTEEHDR